MKVIGLALLVGAPLKANAVFHTLKFLGDSQTGDYDTDAAENVAYDTATMRAFVASAESKDLQVVDLSDPTNLERIGTISVSSNLETECVEIDCIYEEMDFGGNGAACGFADTVKIVHDREDFTCCGWFGGEFEVDATMTSAEACQALCAAEADCDFFSFERECEAEELDDGGEICKTDPETGENIIHNECYLKSAYSEAQGGDDCIDYVVWSPGPSWYNHDYDPNWYGAAGPAACGYFQTESVQSVGIINVDGYDNAIVAAAAPHTYEFADGYLAFFDAKELFYMGCAPAGNKPEGITSDGPNARLACINEGSARDDGLVDHGGSSTVCDVTVTRNPTTVNFNCETYTFAEENFADGAFAPGGVFRSRNLRLYGPEADNLELDLEPEGGAFVTTTDLGDALLVSLQDNNGYALLDLASRKYTYIGGYDGLPATMDASDRDGYINIKSRWGTSSSTPVTGLAMPDQVASFTVGGVQYLITANEGGSRDDGGMLGLGEAVDGTEIEGEEVRFGDVGSPSVATCSDNCEDDTELGRLLTTVYMGVDFATNACGGNGCSAQEVADGLDTSSFSCIYKNYDYGSNFHTCDFATNPTDAYYVNSADWEAPAWYSGEVTVDTTMTSPEACQALCAANSNICDYFSYEFEQGFHECLFKFELTNCPYDEYGRWYQEHFDPNWVGASGPGVCPFSRPPYTTSMDASDTTGTTGGVYSIGGRSMTIWKVGSSTSPLELVYDSGSLFEELTAAVNNDLCAGCDSPSAPSSCETTCPFNSDEAPPAMDDRSDAKGPEPECVTVGVAATGAVLAFVGLERTGGIVVFDVSDPANPQFQDFLNVRNWLVDESVPDEDDSGFSDYMINYALNDGPESLVFIPAADSPIGQDMLLAATPLAGRITAYVIEESESLRGHDGSCANTATCPYIATNLGGTGTARELTLGDVCAFDSDAPCTGTTTGGGETVVITEKKKSGSSNNGAIITLIIILVIVFVVAMVAIAVLMCRVKTYQQKYNSLTEKNMLHEVEMESANGQNNGA
uniref:Choice-of-anchor I domain-containing protein n=1 Tax=Aureoumbra lagunensis TaxID=44058 RepID=A0A7S3NHG6_9STRA